MLTWCERGRRTPAWNGSTWMTSPPSRRPVSGSSVARRGALLPGRAQRPLLASRRMFLRQIQIRGFKSFADRTVLEFIPGVSVIVGPNGSGKSNLVDAISWALGEQGPRALRGGQMADVIFAGTPSRPALGMAEVKLVIDNEAGLIPVPMSEIEVSRSIFRSGESEYRINGKLVRLLDVQELLSESGIGRALHTVVGQGQLEEVLLSRPEERRKYIEEAAGIAKHRRRKERAERKLSSLDHDLLRLSDVMSELRRQLKPLRQQAEMAKKHETLSAQAEELSRKLAAARLRGLLAERERRRGGWDEGLAQREEARARLDALDSEVLARADARAAVARRLAEVRAPIPERGGRPGRGGARRSGSPSIARARRGRRSRPRRAVRRDSTRSRRSSRASRRISTGPWRSSPNGSASSRKPKRRSGKPTSIGARSTSSGGERARRPSGRRVEIEALERAISSGEREGDRLEAELGAVRERSTALRAEREEIEADIERLDGQTSPFAERRTQLETNAVARSRRSRSSTTSSAGSRRGSSSWRLAGATSRRRPDLASSSAHRGRAAGVLKDLVRAEPGLERALLAALGPLADAVVFEDRDQALAAAPEGDGAILAIAAGGPVPHGLSGERPLLSAVDAEPAARGIVSTVLRDVYLAGSIEEAAEKQDAHPTASFVTPDGTLVGPAVIHTPREDRQPCPGDPGGAPGARPRPRGDPEPAEAATTADGGDVRRDRVPEPADRGRRRRHHDGRRAPGRDRARSRGGRHGRRPVRRAPAERARGRRPSRGTASPSSGPPVSRTSPSCPRSRSLRSRLA